MKKDKRLIPPGPYCYTYAGHDEITEKPIYKNCPYWGYKVDEPTDETAVYCSYVNKSDIILLNDQCKICDISMDWEDFGQGV